jgi:hypothetical protein
MVSAVRTIVAHELVEEVKRLRDQLQVATARAEAAELAHGQLKARMDLLTEAWELTRG